MFNFHFRNSRGVFAELRMFEPRSVARVCVDVCCLLLAGLPFSVLNVQHQPFRRGFFCSDDSIRFPYREDTISYQLLMGLMIPAALLTLVCGECVHVYLGCGTLVVRECVWRVYRVVGCFLFGAAVSQSLTDVVKYSSGRLRPHFISVCRPRWSLIDCSAGYIQNFTCSGDPHATAEARLSFYSGHSSFSMYCSLFLSLYLQVRLRSDWFRLLRPTLQFSLMCVCVYVSLTRVSDYKHHWSDVLTGLVQGAAAALFTVLCVSDLFCTRSDSDQSEQGMSCSGLQENSEPHSHYGSCTS